MSDVPASRILVTAAALSAAIAEIPSGDGVLDPEEKAAVVEQVLDDLEPPISLTVLYANAKL